MVNFLQVWALFVTTFWITFLYFGGNGGPVRERFLRYVMAPVTFVTLLGLVFKALFLCSCSVAP